MASSTVARRLPIADCWNQIGVQGDGSCSQLPEHVHCKSCPTYSEAAHLLLDRELPVDYGARWARHFAEPRVDPDVDLQSVVIFRIGAEWLALPTTAIEEVASVRPIHRLPHRKSGVVLGVANVRGELVVCVSLDHVLGAELRTAPQRENAPRALERLLVLCRGSSRFAAPVDEVYGTLRFSRAELVPTPATLSKGKGAFTTHVMPWAAHSVGCLEQELLFRALERNLA
jgi:chemotaxis-related protein WspD